jgi:uncharacterized protein (TIGR03435 family)
VPKEGGVSVASLPLRTLIAWIYDVPNVQVFGPEALRQAYDISADVSPRVSERNRYGSMMRDLLARHLGVKLVQQKKEMQGYVLEVVPSSSKKLKKEKGPFFGFRYGLATAERIEVENLPFNRFAKEQDHWYGWNFRQRPF